MFKVPNQYRVGGRPEHGNNGIFILPGTPKIKVVASDGYGWEHVSVSVEKKRVPSWHEMCRVKDLFWDDDDTVIQYHPPKTDYVNIHPFVLHLWRPIGIELQRPPTIMV